MADPAETSGSLATEEIMQNLQTLTDIEGDLADAAIAVAAGSSDGPTMEAPTAAAAVVSEQDKAAEKAVLESAEQVETALEHCIPAAPPPHSQDATDTTHAVPDAAPSDGVDHSSSAAGEPAIARTSIGVPDDGHRIDVTTPATTTAAHEAHAAIEAVEADVMNPVLPETVLPPAHDVQAETQVEEETSPIKVDIVAPPNPDTSAPPAPAQQQQPSQQPEQQRPSEPSQPGPSIQAPPQQQDDAMAGVASAPGPSVEQKPLPDGLSNTSPSVVSNPDLMRIWNQDPTDAMTLLALFNWSIQRTEIQDARTWYRELARENPTATQPLLALINLELALSNFAQVEALFAQALKGSLGEITAAADVSVWKAYLHYIRRQNPVAEGSQGIEQARTTITNAYEFALKECGTDRESGEIWQEYISFIADATPKNTWETQVQVDNLRKTYQRAVCIPLNNVEPLWRAYDAFESATNKLTAKKFLAERSPSYMTARTALKELRSLTDVLPRPILPPKPTFSEQDRQTVTQWKAYLKWEESNPLVIEDQSVLAARVGYAMRKCLGEMRHFPEMWHYAATYHAKGGRADEAAATLKAGVEACPKSVLLTFAYAEVEEDRKNLAACHTAFDNLLTLLNKEVEELRVQVEQEINIARGPDIPMETNGAAGNGASMDMDVDGEISQAQKMIEERDARVKLVTERRGKDVEDVKKAIGVVWVMYMRFARRAEAARAVFGKSRKSGNITWHVFEASAMMEYHNNKDAAVATRIFELGLKQFAEETDYVIKYLQFLLSINDDTNARALFERSAVKISATKARPLWDTWARYEYMYADLGAVQKLEARFAEVYPNDSPLKRFAQRFVYDGIDQIALRDLGFGRSATSSGGGARQPAPASTAQGGSPAGKRPLHGRHGSIDRSASPSRDQQAKRYRQASPAGPPMPPRTRFDGNRPGPGGPGGLGVPPQQRGGGRGSKERSMPPQQQQQQQQQPPHGQPPYGGPGPRGSLPPQGGGPPFPPAPGAPGPGMPPVGQPPVHPRDQLDRSGLTRSLTWFIGQLPNARSFDGPTFRPDDIMGLFSNIDRTGTGAAPQQSRYAQPLPQPYRRY